MLLQDYDITTRYQAKVLSNERITEAASKEDVREILIEVEHQDFHAWIGQNIGVLAPGRREIGQEHHFRLYSVADLPQKTAAGQQLCICVRRCSYIDQFSGEEYPGIASNYLCDLSPGDTITVTGPYGQAFELPEDHHATLILIGAGTGIAPFRGFVKYIYTHHTEFSGRIWLFHGAQTGLDLLYRNEEKNDFALYYDHDTFEAFDALSKRPGWSDATDWGEAMHSRAEELCKLLSDPKTYVYLAGLEKIRDELNDVLAEIAGSNQTWFHWKAELEADHRWIELLY
jgi:ferredoxin--NADP+ reductase